MEARELAASMDKNASIDQMLLTIEYHAKSISTSNRWIEACLCHLNITVLPAFTKSIKESSP